MKNKFRFGSTGFWVGLLVVLLIVLNVIAFIVYKEANPDKDIWVQCWAYLETGTFKVITISLFLPIILLILESHFRILESIRQNRLELELQRKEELREKRLNCIEATSDLWNQIWDLSTQVVFYRTGTNKDSKKDQNSRASIGDLTVRLTNLCSSGEDVVNMWDHRFKGHLHEDEIPFLTFINTLLMSTATVATCIWKGENEEELLVMQGSLDEIRSAIKSIAHHRILNIFKNTMRLLEVEETRASSKEMPKIEEEEVQKIKDKLQKDRKDVRYWASELLKREVMHNYILAHKEENQEVKSFQEAFKKIQQWVFDNPKEQLDKYEEYSTFKQMFYEIPYEKRFRLYGPGGYSKEYIRHITDWLALYVICWAFTRPID